MTGRSAALLILGIPMLLVGSVFIDGIESKNDKAIINSSGRVYIGRFCKRTANDIQLTVEAPVGTLTILDRFRLRAWSNTYNQCIVRWLSVAAGGYEFER